jgi:hypothetical protein
MRAPTSWSEPCQESAPCGKSEPDYVRAPSESSEPSRTDREHRDDRASRSLTFVGGVLLAALSGCGHHHASRAQTWTSCPRPSSAADIRQFRVRGGETCSHGSRVLGYTAFGHEGSCGDACRYLGYTCREHPGGLRSNSSGGSYYTYEDDACVRGPRRAAWRIVFH